jgi:ABC-type multidrug transport system fused ATPase/permease subunit
LRFGLKIFDGTASLAEFTLIWMLMNQITGILFDLNEIMGNYYGQMVFVEKLRSTFDDIPKLKGYDEGKTFKLGNGEIVLDNVAFNYGNKNIFENFSLHIE